MAVLFLIFLDQICPKWIKFDQIGFLTNLKILQQKVVTFTFIVFDFDLSKMDQSSSSWISHQSKKCYYKKFSHLQIG